MAGSAAAGMAGIHHITAICGDPQRNVDFYMGVLGLRLVKKTINFDDPGTYHLYYGDGLGSPHLKLPEWLEPRREWLEAKLPELRLPAARYEAVRPLLNGSVE